MDDTNGDLKDQRSTNTRRSFLAVIPARAGSKRLPNKNIVDFNGKPLVTWTIDSALKSGVFTDVVVSTDSQAIADIATAAGASVPYLSSAELSSDTAKVVDVLLDVVDYFERSGRFFDAVVILQPTSPLRQAEDITKAVQIYTDITPDFVVSVCPCSHSPLFAGRFSDDGSMNGFIKPEHVIRSQDLPQFYRLNGAVFICNTERLKKVKTIEYGSRTFPYIMDIWRSFDIDEQLDLEVAEFVHSKKTLQN